MKGFLLLKEKQFTWSDKTILFDELEELLLQAGLKSPLMYCHLSPGLLRVKAQHSDAPGQRLAHRLVNLWLVTPCQNENARLSAAIHDGLDVGEELGHPLAED